jgi:hypothetical protein
MCTAAKATRSNAMTQKIFDFIGFMDHSGSDELTGDSEHWHSTALVMSEGDRVMTLTKQIADDLSNRSVGLGKWSKRKPSYRNTFTNVLAERLPKSKVFIAAFSARGRKILMNKITVINELGLSEIYREEVDHKNRTVSVIGPVFNQRDEEITFRMLEKRAMMLLWISHFLVRFHLELKRQWTEWKPETEGLTWELYINKFVGDDQSSAKALNFFQGFTSRYFPIRTTFFHESNVVTEEVLADSLAGLINEHARHRDRYPAIERIRESKGFHYEIYD